jgi:hypothetical protein
MNILSMSPDSPINPVFFLYTSVTDMTRNLRDSAKRSKLLIGDKKTFFCALLCLIRAELIQTQLLDERNFFVLCFVP